MVSPCLPEKLANIRQECHFRFQIAGIDNHAETRANIGLHIDGFKIYRTDVGLSIYTVCCNLATLSPDPSPAKAGEGRIAPLSHCVGEGSGERVNGVTT